MAIPQDFINSLRKTGGPALPAKFEVEFEAPSVTNKIEEMIEANNTVRDLKFRCHQAVIPGLTAATSQYQTGMPEKNNPYRATFEDVTLGFYCSDGTDKGLPERNFFEQWQNSIFAVDRLGVEPGPVPKNQAWPIAYRNEYTRNVTISKLTQSGNPNMNYVLHNAFPVTISDTELTWAEEEILKIEVVFSYDWWTKHVPLT